MSVTSVVKIINNKKIVFTAVAAFFVPYILFCFWNVPSADDYLILYKKQTFSFWGLQNWVYHTWSGRYFSTFISSAFSYSGFLYSHYYLHTILLLFFTFFAWMFLIRRVNKFLLSGSLTSTFVVLASLFLLILELEVIPEPVTAFYWFSSAVTYQVPLILMLFLCGVCIKMFLGNGSKKANFIIAGLLIFMVNGCNEAITLFVLITSTFFVGCYYSIYKKISAIVIGLYMIAIISSCFLLFAPGILNRSALHEASPLLSIISIAFIKFIVLNWFFLKEPLWWFSLLFASSIIHHKRHLYYQLFKHFTNRSSGLLLLIYLLSGLLIYVPILYVSNASLPLRTENILCFLYSLILIFIISIFICRASTSLVFAGELYSYRYLLFSILIFSSGNMKKVTDSLLSGYFYKQVMQERLSILEEAKRAGQSEITFSDYESSVAKKLYQYPFFQRKILKEIILKAPPVICFQSDFYNLSYVKELYGIKKYNIINK